MRMLAFLSLTLGLVLAWALPLAARRGPRGDVLVYAGLLAAATLVLVQMTLGIAGLLRLPLLVGALLAVGVAAAATAGRVWRAGVATAPPRAGLDAAVREIAGPANLALGALALFVCVWMAAAAWLLPPRGVDDLAYHLPPLLEAAQSGRLTLLPLSVRQQFAMPLGGGLLALWPLVFFHAVTWIDATQFAVALYCAGAVYAVARALGAARSDAALAGLLFLLTPVVLAQSGSNYTDVTLAACQLALLYAAVRYWRSGGALHLAMAGLAAGLGFATKYNMLVAIAVAQPLLGLGMWRHGRLAGLTRGYALFGAAALPLAAYWPARNWLATGFPLFPYDVTPTGLRALIDFAQAGPPEPALGSALGKLLKEPGRLLLFLFRDPGLGSLNGGLGATFYALGLPALAWCLWRAARAVAARDALPALFWLQAPAIALVYLAQTDVGRLPFNQRLVIPLVAFALAALALLLGRLRATAPGAAGVVAGAGVLAAALAVVQLAAATLPPFQLRAAALERRLGVETSPYHYLGAGTGDLPAQAPVWDLLDFLSMDSEGWEVYVAAPWPAYWTAPAYGTRLQNRVWNFHAQAAAPPDALVYQLPLGAGFELFYPVGAITPDDARRDARYVLVRRAPHGELWLRRDRLVPAVRARLDEYRRRRPDAELAP